MRRLLGLAILITNGVASQYDGSDIHRGRHIDYAHDDERLHGHNIPAAHGSGRERQDTSFYEDPNPVYGDQSYAVDGRDTDPSLYHIPTGRLPADFSPALPPQDMRSREPHLSQYPTGEDEGQDQDADLSNLDKDVVFEGLKRIYMKKVKPLEMLTKYSYFYSPPLNPSDFDAKPMVLIIGQYSVGKTSFIRSLLKQDFPGQRIGPEPTTDRFVAIMHGEEEQVVPGHALAMQSNMPFQGLLPFGNNFLTKFEGSFVDSPILHNITLIDTPGILAGEKQRIGRDYDFAAVIEWLADRADMIIVMFDAHKLDISDELKQVMDILRSNQDKMRVLLNKADTIDSQQLMRVYGALMWSLGKVVQTPEVCRVYIGSFWENTVYNPENAHLLEKEKRDLIAELGRLPENAVLRRMNELVKRIRSVKVHAYIIHYLRKQMPYIGRAEKQAKLIRRLEQEFLACSRRYNLPIGDFPKVEKYRSTLLTVKDITKFNKLDKNMVYEMDKVFTNDIPRLLEKACVTSRSKHR